VKGLLVVHCGCTSMTFPFKNPCNCRDAAVG
jgi:hypothetical protein